MPRSTPSRFRKTLLALAVGAVLAPCGAWALDLATAPPGTVEPYVRPNVIISVDDSGSMGFCLNKESTSNCDGLTDATNNTEPDATTKSWPVTSRRMNVLKYSLRSVFDPTHPNYDSNLLPDGKIRLAWQAMWNNGNSVNRYSDLDYWYGGNTSNPGKGKTPGAQDVSTPVTGSNNQIKILDANHRGKFLEFVNYLLPQNGTPSHKMFSQADAYMRQSLDIKSAWASKPGETGAPFLGCRRTYHIMMTDGRWNSTPSVVLNNSQRDNAANLTLPDGMVYSGNKSALYRDESSTTLADWAFYSWANPLQTSGLTGTMQPTADYRKAPATETFTNTSGSSVTLDRYWNPHYNPATWPHMVTYTIGFSKMAFEWNFPSIQRPTDVLPFGYNGSFPDLAKDTVEWPNLTKDTDTYNSLDLWHAALNGRGRFYAVEKGEDLETAFRDIFKQINTATDPDLSASATSGSNLSRSSVGKYTAGYEPANFWKGFVKADTVTSDGTTTPAPGWEGKSTADRLDALSDVSTRLILSWSDQWVSTRPKGGVPFKWATDETNLSTAQKAMLGLGSTAPGVTVATNGQNRLNYIRGDRTLEGVDPTGYTSAKPYRQRKSRQGDIINSDVWYTGAPAGDSLLKGYAAFVRSYKNRPGMLYVGGNDGMLHGFAAADGTEKLAYVPRGVIPTLKNLTATTYNDNHRYFVDGTPMTGDVDLNGGMQDPQASGYDTYTPNWRTMLVGTLGAGGKGYFVLDVTNPTAAAAPSGSAPAFTETNAANLVVLDRSRGTTEPAPNCDALSSGAEKTACLLAVDEDKDIGHITAKPVTDDNDDMRATQITRMNDNRWAVVMGNGYNSANQRPVLLVQYLDGDKKLVRIPAAGTVAEPPSPGTGIAADNGLGAPRLVDLNGDGRIDIAYAGDNLGNLWKFDLTSSTASNWVVAFGGAPLFTASGPAALNGTTRPKVQPISAPPTVRANDRMKTVGTGANAKNVRVGGMMVAFGTGRNVGRTDPESVDVQTLYSVLDNTRYREVGTGAAKRLEVHPGGGSCPNGADCVPTPTALGAGVTTAKLAKQVIEELNSGELGGIKPADTSNELKLETWANFNGWYVDFPAVGERLLKSMKFYDSSNLMTVYSQVPAKGSNVDPSVESCESVSVDEERQYRSFINIMDGKAPSVAVVDANNDGKFNMSTGDGFLVNSKYVSISRKKVEKGPHVIITTSNKHENVGISAKNNKEKLARLPEQSLRPTWRQLQ